MAERDEGKKEKGKKWDRKEKEKKKKLTSALSLFLRQDQQSCRVHCIKE